MLHSCINNLVQIYNFSEFSSGSSALVSSSDPSVLDFAIDGSGRTTKIFMEPMQYGDIGKERYDLGLGRSYMEKDIKFFRLFVSRSDLTVHELVVYTQHPNGNQAIDSEQSVEDFTRSLVIHPRRNTSKREVKDEDSEFILPDGLTIVEAPRSKTASQIPKWGHDHTTVHDARDNGLLVNALLRREYIERGTSKSIDVGVVTNQVKQMLVDDFDPTLPVGTL
jgi:RNA polymerase I-specific transcription initiation factor RRN6